MWGVALIIVSFLLALVPCVGQLAALFIIYAVQAFLMFGLFLIVDENMEFWPASMESVNKVKTNFWPFLALSVVSSIIGSIGAILCGIGVVITAPIQATILTVAYRDIFSGVVVPSVAEETESTGADPAEEASQTE